MVLGQPGGAEITFPVLLRDNKGKQPMHGGRPKGYATSLYAFEILGVAVESGVVEGDVIPPQFKSPA